MKNACLDQLSSLSTNGSAMRQEFDAAVESIFAIRNSDGLAFLSFVKRTLAQFRLEAIHDVLDIVAEAYLRGVRLVEKGTEIRNPGAWLRVTAHNIIREYSRNERRDRRDTPLIESKIISYGLSDDEDDYPEKKLDEQLKAVWNAFHQIPDADREIIVNRYFYEKSWNDIRRDLRANGEQVDVGTLRVRGSRALKRLRKKYHEAIDSSANASDTLRLCD